MLVIFQRNSNFENKENALQIRAMILNFESNYKKKVSKNWKNWNFWDWCGAKACQFSISRKMLKMYPMRNCTIRRRYVREPTFQSSVTSLALVMGSDFSSWLHKHGFADIFHSRQVLRTSRAPEVEVACSTNHVRQQTEELVLRSNAKDSLYEREFFCPSAVPRRGSYPGSLKYLCAGVLSTSFPPICYHCRQCAPRTERSDWQTTTFISLLNACLVPL